MKLFFTGQGYISLLDIIENNGTKTSFDTNSCLFGKIIGLLQGFNRTYLKNYKK